MKVVPKSTGPLWDRLDTFIIGEQDDPRATLPISICVKDLSGNLVASGYTTYTPGFDPVVKVYSMNISNINVGEYIVEYYNDVSCINPLNTLLISKYYIDKRVRNIVNPGWDPSKARGFAFYVYNGKVYYYYADWDDYNLRVPSNIDTVVEIVGDDGNAYADMINVNNDTWVSPNVRIPFLFTIRFKTDRAISYDTLSYVGALAGFGYKLGVYKIDDYTFDVKILKDEPGVPFIVFILIGMAIAGGTVVGVAYFISRIEWAKAEQLNQMKWYEVAQANRQIINQMLGELNQCGTNMECIRTIYMKYMPLLQLNRSFAESIRVTLEETGGGGEARCDGIKLGSTCIPWWVFMFGFIAVVVLLLRR